MKKPTRERLLDAAQHEFAKQGFIGTSIRQIADHVGVTKQALLHHFKSKEKLYYAVLERVVSLLTLRVQEAAQGGEGELEILERIIESLSSWLEFDSNAPRLVLREILDNQERAEDAERWVMRPLINFLTDLVRSGQEKGIFSDVHPLLFIYFLIGAQHYFLVSLPTLRNLARDEDEYEEMLDLHIDELKKLCMARLLKQPEDKA